MTSEVLAPMTLFGRYLQFATALMLALATPCASAQADLISRGSFEAIDCTAEPGAPGCPDVIGETPKLELSPGESETYCYYFRAANKAPVDFARTYADVDGNVSSAELYATHNALGIDVERMPPGTVSVIGCGLLVALDGTVASLLATLNRDGTLRIVDDLLGSVPDEVRPNQPLFVKVTMSNRTNAMASGRVRWLARP